LTARIEKMRKREKEKNRKGVDGQIVLGERRKEK
jgi:hypothetical protein